MNEKYAQMIIKCLKHSLGIISQGSQGRGLVFYENIEDFSENRFTDQKLHLAAIVIVALD